jgi:hypothetical protein
MAMAMAMALTRAMAMAAKKLQRRKQLTENETRRK